VLAVLSSCVVLGALTVCWPGPQAPAAISFTLQLAVLRVL
jgi:hypothetical protein